MWSRGGSELFYRAATDSSIMIAPYQVEADAFNVAKPSRWSATAVETRGPFRNFDVHPDGTRFAVMTAVADERKRDHVTLFLDFSSELRRMVPVR